MIWNRNNICASQEPQIIILETQLLASFVHIPSLFLQFVFTALKITSLLAFIDFLIRFVVILKCFTMNRFEVWLYRRFFRWHPKVMSTLFALNFHFKIMVLMFSIRLFCEILTFILDFFGVNIWWFLSKIVKSIVYTHNLLVFSL